MSERKQTAAENTAAVEKTGPVVYCGPSVKNTVKQFTVYSDGDALPIYAMFKLGGFLDMSGYRYQQLLGYRYAYARALYQTRLARVPLFEGVYGGLAYEIADMPQLIALNDQRLFQSGTAYLAVDTPLGVAYFGLGYANKDNVAVYLQGKPF